MTNPQDAERAELVERLREQAQRTSEASKMLAEHRNAEYRARGDADANYGWLKPEQTLEWRAAAALSSPALMSVSEGMVEVLQSLPGYPWLPCPICNGTEGCDHSVLERRRAALQAAIANGGEATSFQQRVQPWMMACFGAEISADRGERNHRFLEEALELVQASGCTQDEAHQLVDYVYGRPQGDINQEVGGVMVTLAAHCLAHGVDLHEAGEKELARIWTKVEQIRAKQAAKPKHSPLPGPGASESSTPSPSVSDGELRDKARIDWLNEQVVNIIDLDDGRIIDARGNDVRPAIDAAMRRFENHTPADQD